MKEQIGKVIIDYEYYSGEDLYSDGKIEDELLEIVKQHTKEKFNSIIADRKDWTILYHLSNLRENIIEWLPITKNDKVLEIGAGCGAITGVLSEKANNVTCIDLSKKRSLINAYRHRTKENINILVGNFQEIEEHIQEKYDYITLIGVFEYGSSYISKEKPYENFLNLVMRNLNENGKIIIAIENKFGLKYWAGCQEDHTGKYFEGIEGYTSTSGVQTFTKRELEKIAKDLGCTNYEFYYPYPDYKFPTTIYSDYYLPKTFLLVKKI
jgi:2-polyprenyl-3-methyl-5-hydroxy-6-metoxy-1,4-benzoquinol methylase